MVFCKVNSDNLVVEVAEKKAISDLATVGIYYFAKGSDFVKAALDMIVSNDRVNGEFYTCPVYNYMIKLGAKIGYEVNKDAMHGLGTPEDLRNYIYSKIFHLRQMILYEYYSSIGWTKYATTDGSLKCCQKVNGAIASCNT